MTSDKWFITSVQRALTPPSQARSPPLPEGEGPGLSGTLNSCRRLRWCDAAATILLEFIMAWRERVGSYGFE